MSSRSGAVCGNVSSRTAPAAKAGIQEGDVITKLGDDEITSADGLIIALRSHEVGEKVEITLMRGKEEKKVTVELGSDEELQNQQQDDSSTDTGNGGITDEQLRQYLEELLGPAGPGSGLRPGLLTSRIAHADGQRGLSRQVWDSPSFLIDPLGTEKTDHLGLTRGLVRNGLDS